MKFKYIPLCVAFSAFTFGLASCNQDNDYPSRPNTDNEIVLEPTDCNSLVDVGAYNTFYKPAKGWVGDPMPFYDNGKFHFFYLYDARDNGVTFHPWHKAETTDFGTFKNDALMIPCGDDNSQERALGTGSVIKAGNSYYAFYTAHNGALFPKEKIMVAVSSDLSTWSKTDFLLEAADGYDKNEFRDPFVIFDSSANKYKMFLTTRSDHGGWGATVAQYSCATLSTNAADWTLDTPFFHDNGIFITECPDIFTEGDYEYLLYSDINDRMVHYRYRKVGTTNWIIPTNTLMDGIAYYAGRTASDGTTRYLTGWCPTRTATSDLSEYSWAGSLVVHKLTQQTDGSLTLSIPNAVANKFITTIDNKVISTNNATSSADTYTLNAASERASVLFERITTAAKITTTIEVSSATKWFGFEFGACGDQTETYALRFDLNANELRLDQMRNNNFSGVILNKIPLTVPADRKFEVTFVSEQSVCAIYVNGTLAFTNRLYKMNQNPWAIFAENGEVKFTNLKVQK